MTGPQGPAAEGSGRLRAGHADRERVLEALKDAFVDGRLTRDELDARAGRALAARTYAELDTLTSDIPAAPAAPAAAGPACPPTLVRRPLARAAARSGGCLVIAAAAVRLGALADPDPPGPTPYHSFAPLCFLIAFFAVLAALGFVIHGVGTAWEQRHPDGKPPPPPRQDVTRRIS